MLQINNITKIYGKGKTAFKALDNVSINFGSSGLIVILGKSGCGKSTLLNIVGGLDMPTTGDVVINGHSTSRFTKADFDAYRNTYVGIVFQEFNLIDDITVFENIDMTLKLQEKSADVNTVDEALSLVGLQNLGYRKPTELSGGQRQRVALARALLKKPEIILADEPTGALDTNTSEEVFETLKKIAETKLVVVVTHDRDLATTYGERIIEMVDGNIVSDSEREKDSIKVVKELSKNVVEVAVGGEVSRDIITNKLSKDKVNYIGISHDKDRIALAYTETVDSFYAPKENIVFAPTDANAIKNDQKAFSLSKGRLPLKEAIKMSRDSIKRSKKRYRFLTRLNIICFTILTIALIIGSISLPNLTAKTAFEKGSQPVVAVSGINYDNYYPSFQKLSETNITELESIFGGAKYGRSFSIEFTPSFADRKFEQGNMGGNWGYNETNTDFSFEKINGVIEGVKPEDIGIKILEGTSSFSNLTEIIISDLAAYELTRSGYVGYDKNDTYGIHYPKEYSDLILSKISPTEQSNSHFRIIGIYETNYGDFKHISTASKLDTEAQKDISIFGANKSFMYSKIFASNGFTKTYNSAVSSDSNINFTIQSTSDNNMRVNSQSSYTKMQMSIENFERAQSGKILSWVKEGIETNNEPMNDGTGRVNNLPKTLSEKQILIDVELIRNIISNITGEYNLTASQVLVHEKFPLIVSSSMSLRAEIYSGTSNTILPTTEGFEIVGVYNLQDWQVQIQVSPALVQTMLSGGDMPESLIFNRGTNQLELQGRIDTLMKSKYMGGTARADILVMAEVNDILKTMGQIFTYIALGFCLFSFLIIFNYISASVRFRQKEVAVYRVVGAKPFDISKIFLSEGFFIVVKTTIWSSIFSFILCISLNAIVASLASMFGISFTLINFTVLHPFVIFFICALFVLLSSLIPISRITRKKPVDAVKML